MNFILKQQQGFTLIEVIVLIIVTGLLGSTLLLGARTALIKTPDIHQQWRAMQTAQQCMEWFLGKKRLNGYDSITCPSTSTPSACSAPAGFTVSTSITCTTWNNDAYKTITITVSGLANAALSMQIGNV